MAVYPEPIIKRSGSLSNVGLCGRADAMGRAASFSCGCFVAFSLEVEDGKVVSEARFISNGCGYMVASADVLASLVSAKPLTELRSLNGSELIVEVRRELGDFPSDREGCIDCVTDALRSAFADYRKRRVEEFQGEKALICTCFGVSEETIERYIEASGASSVEDVTRALRAGGGCGSCVMLIQEMLDSGEGKILPRIARMTRIEEFISVIRAIRGKDFFNRHQGRCVPSSDRDNEGR